MTAPASTPMSASAPSIGQLAEEQVRRTVKALRSAHDVSIKAICERTGISRGTYFSRMNGSTPFTAGEVAELADLLRVSVGDLYSGRLTLGPVPPDIPFRGSPETPGATANGGRLTHQYVEREQAGVVLRPQFRPSPAAVVASATTAIGEREAS